MTRLLAAASGTLLAVAAIASSATVYADEPNDQNGQVSTQSAPGANLTGAVQQADPGGAHPGDAGTLGPIGDNAAHSPAANSAGDGAGNPAHDGTARPDDEATHPADDGMAAAPAAGGMNNMGASIGTSMAMMAPMMAMYVPMMGAPLLMSGLGSLGAAPSTGADAATAASAAATDALGLPSSVASDLSNLDLTPNLDAGDLPGVTTDALTSALGAGLPDAVDPSLVDPSLVDPSLVDPSLVDPSPLVDTLGDMAPGIAEAGTGIGTTVGTEVACGVVGLIFGAC